MPGAHPEDRDQLFLTESPRILSLDLADGTNVPPDTDYIYAAQRTGTTIDLAQHREAHSWAEHGTRLLESFRGFREIARPVGVVLTQQRSPSFGGNGEPSTLKYQPRISRSSGVSVDCSQLLDRTSRAPISGLFPFLSGDGEPIRFTNGDPIGLRLGFTRDYNVFEPSRFVNDDRAMLSVRLAELCKECGDWLLGVPSEAIQRIWSDCGQYFVVPSSDEPRWHDALFEFCWTSRTRSERLSRNVYDASGNSSLVLRNCGLHPRATDLIFRPDEVIAHKWPTEAGYPFKWSSEIKDITAESIRLLEWLVCERWKQERSVVGPLKLFVSYCHVDERVVDRLKVILKPLIRNGEIELWYDRHLLPGTNLDSEIAEQVKTADAFAFIVSDDFLASDYCTGVELKKALERASTGEAAVLGIVARPCVWRSVFPSELLLLPKDGKPISAWKPQDDAWLFIAKEFQRLVRHLKQTPKPWLKMRPHTS